MTDAGICAVSAQLAALQLRRLDLAGENVSDASMHIVVSLTALTRLRLASTCVSVTGIALCAERLGTVPAVLGTVGIAARRGRGRGAVRHVARHIAAPHRLTH